MWGLAHSCRHGGKAMVGGFPAIFFVTFYVALIPRRNFLELAVGLSIGGACLAEFFQLWHWGWLLQFRSNPFGAALLGSSFRWSDIPKYFTAGGIGYLLFRTVFWAISCRQSDVDSVGIVWLSGFNRWRQFQFAWLRIFLNLRRIPFKAIFWWTGQSLTINTCFDTVWQFF